MGSRRKNRRRTGTRKSRKGLIWLGVLGIVAGGLLLGLLGGELVDPEMTRNYEGIGGKDPNAAAREQARAYRTPADLLDPPESGLPDVDDFGGDDPDMDSAQAPSVEPLAPFDPLPPPVAVPPGDPLPAPPARTRGRPAPQPTGEDDLPAIY